MTIKELIEQLQFYPEDAKVMLLSAWSTAVNITRIHPNSQIDKRPSPEYLEVMKEAIQAVAKREGL